MCGRGARIPGVSGCLRLHLLCPSEVRCGGGCRDRMGTGCRNAIGATARWPSGFSLPVLGTRDEVLM